MHTIHGTGTPGRAKKALLALLLATTPAVALARDICVQEFPFNPRYVFSKVTTLRPGRVVALTGVRVFPGIAVEPVHGTAVMRADGSVNIGVLVHNMNAAGNGNEFLAVLETDADFTGTGRVDGDGTFTADGSVTWTSVDCDTVEFP